MNSQDQLIRLKAARIRLVRNHIFFGAIAMRLHLQPEDSLPSLAGVDGKNIFFNPTQLADVSSSQLEGLLAHEALHIMLLHHLRRGSRDPKKWNIAGDHAINLTLLAERFELPANGLHDPKYRGMSAEQIYALLPDSPTGEGFDIVMDGNSNMLEKEVKAEEERIKAAVVNAAALARKAGQMTAGIERLIEAICEPKANWQTVLAEYVTEIAAHDFDWARPSQRHLHQYGIICPTLDSRDKLGRIGIGNDASGSTLRFQEQFASEISDILSQFDCTITVLNHDTEVKSVDEYSSDDLPIQLKIVGCGGTRFDTFYTTVRDEYDFDLLIHLTDGEASWRGVEAPSCPVIVACCGDTGTIAQIPGWARVVSLS